jgi:N-methylhydantoinase B/oxoprolinase/acetone carboxylase alpha subunit
MKPDPIELELFRHLLVSIAEEMGAVLRKTSYSANIKERRDYSCALYDAAGETVAMGDHMPVHLGAMPLSVRHATKAFDLKPGDVAILNDPFRGGTHLPDITAVSAVFIPGDRKPSFYVANRAHHADVGGMSPGSMPLAREIYQEGIRIPPILLVRGGKFDRPRSVKAICWLNAWPSGAASSACWN